MNAARDVSFSSLHPLTPSSPRRLTPSSQPSVLIIGGGLAGLATATVLASSGFQATILEARGRLGGRAGSFKDSASGQLVDACQHVSMGCCTEFARFCRTVGIAHWLTRHATMWFMTADRRVSRLAADRLPAPFHLARSFHGVHFLTQWEKLRIAWGLAHLKLMPDDADPPFLQWLETHGQTPRTIERFWGLVLTSALNEIPERIGLKYARKVFVEGFLRSRQGFEIEVPTVPLGHLYEQVRLWLESRGAQAHLDSPVRRISVTHGLVRRLELRDGRTLEADWYVSALPQARLLDLLPSECVSAEPYFEKLSRLEVSPITSVHLWYARPVCELPHVVLVGCAGQWIFNRGQSGPGEHYLQVVVSASRQFRGLGHEEVQRRIVEEMGQLFPEASPKNLLRARVVTEQAATFSAVPGVDQWRPPQISPIRNLFVAGDWTATGWPATMEGAVRSGFLAAEALLARAGVTG